MGPSGSKRRKLDHNSDNKRLTVQTSTTHDRGTLGIFDALGQLQRLGKLEEAEKCLNDLLHVYGGESNSGDDNEDDKPGRTKRTAAISSDMSESFKKSPAGKGSASLAKEQANSRPRIVKQTPSTNKSLARKWLDLSSSNGQSQELKRTSDPKMEYARYFNEDEDDEEELPVQVKKEEGEGLAERQDIDSMSLAKSVRVEDDNADGSGPDQVTDSSDECDNESIVEEESVDVEPLHKSYKSHGSETTALRKRAGYYDVKDARPILHGRYGQNYGGAHTSREKCIGYCGFKTGRDISRYILSPAFLPVFIKYATMLMRKMHWVLPPTFSRMMGVVKELVAKKDRMLDSDFPQDLESAWGVYLDKTQSSDREAIAATEFLGYCLFWLIHKGPDVLKKPYAELEDLRVQYKQKAEAALGYTPDINLEEAVILPTSTCGRVFKHDNDTCCAERYHRVFQILQMIWKICRRGYSDTYSGKWGYTWTGGDPFSNFEESSKFRPPWMRENVDTA